MARTKKTPVAEQTIDEKAKLKKEVNRLKDLLAAALNIIKKQDDKLDELEKRNRISMLELSEKTMHIDFLVGKWMKESMRKKYGK
jgi:hypothetical protein